MSDLSKKQPDARGLATASLSTPATQNLQPHDPTFQEFSQIQLVIPRAVFDRAGLTLTYENVMRIVDEVLLPMPRFHGFQCDRRFWHDHKGNGRIILERTHFGNIVNLTLPDDFILPPVVKELPPTKLPE